MRLLRIEMRRVLRSPWFLGSMLVLSVLATVSAVYQIVNYSTNWKWIIEKFSDESYYYHTIYSCFNMWLPMHAGDDAAALFFMLLPLLAIMGYAWSFAADVHGGYVNQLATRASRGRLFAARYAAVFTSAGLLAAVPLLVNFAVLACFMPAYTPSVVDCMYLSIGPNDVFASVFFAAPGLYVVLRCCLNFVLCGLWGAMVLGFSTLTTNRIALVCVPYIALLLLKHLGENFYVMMRLRGYEHFGMSITLFDQLKGTPDSFYCYWWATLACAVLMAVLSVAIPYMRRKADIL
jgi:hypothetical protein